MDKKLDKKLKKSKSDKLFELGFEESQHQFFSDISVELMYKKFKHMTSVVIEGTL